jgi:transcription initiation factor TFIIB
VKEIGKCYKFIVKTIDGLNTQMMEQMITPEKLVNRFCGNLGLANVQFLKLATAVVGSFRKLRDSEGHKSEKQPASVAAAAIYLCSQIYEPAARAEGNDPAGDPEGDPALAVDLRRISEVSGMAEGTIRTSYEDMYPYAARMLPEAYRDKVDQLLAPALNHAALEGLGDQDLAGLMLPPI